MQPIEPLRCPTCGAAANPTPGVPMYQCPYCHTTSNLGAAMAPPPPPQPPPQSSYDHDIPRIVVVSPSYSYTSGWSLYWMVRLGAIAIVGIIGAGGFVYSRITGRPSPVGNMAGDDDFWSGKEPLMCDGNDDISVSDVKANFSAGAAIIANGNCKVTCKSCDLKAAVGVQAGGNAEVNVVDGKVEGQVAITASTNAHVNVRGNAKVVGLVNKSGNAEVTGIPAAPSATAVAAAASAPAAHPAAKPAGGTKPAPAPSGKKK